MPSIETENRSTAISVDKIEVVFPNKYIGLNSVCLDVKEGEFCTLLGASGSGKTTLLRVIAGLIEPTVGQVKFFDQDVTNVSIQDRKIGFVFQSYALFPHMTVRENIAFPLSVHKWDKDEAKERVNEVLDLIGLSAFAERAVGELSGGQQQRVAIGRAISYKPKIMLLDEPMGALDRKLRQSLGYQLREIQQETGITTVYVTHDQEEAFILSDRIAVMANGGIVQHDAPENLYFNPRTRFVAGFLGEANIFDISQIKVNDLNESYACSELGEISLGSLKHSDLRSVNYNSLVIRPENIMVSKQKSLLEEHINPISMTLEVERFMGNHYSAILRTKDNRRVLAEYTKSIGAQVHTDVWVSWAKDAAVLIED